MKTTTKLSTLLLAVSLTAALQAYATPVTSFTETVNIPGGVDVYGKPYTGSFTESGLSAGWSDSDTISSAVVDVTMYDAAGNPVYLTIDAIKGTNNFTSNYQTLGYTLTSTQDSYITGKFDANGSFSFTVEADCYLESAELCLTTTTGQTQSVPDASSTMILLGGALSALALLKRKLV